MHKWILPTCFFWMNHRTHISIIIYLIYLYISLNSCVFSERQPLEGHGCRFQKTDYFARISELLRNTTDLAEENKKRRQSLQESPCLGFDSLKRLSPFSYLKSFRISSSAMSMAVFRLFYMIRIISASRMDCFFFFFFSLSFWLWLIGEFSPR